MMQPIDADRVRDALRVVLDPELGLNIVDLGLVYHASGNSEGIEVAFTLTTPSCPMGEFLIEEIRDTLANAFPDAPGVQVRLVWDPPWSPDQMSDSIRQQLA